MSQVKLFISHSERDERFVRPLEDWLRTGLGLAEDEVRCTVVTNMSLGDIPAQALRDDLESAEAIVGLITANSLTSIWAQFEMGAAWLRTRLHPIRGPGMRVDDLRSPLKEFTTVGYCQRPKMKQCIRQLARTLDRSVISETSDAKLEAMVEFAERTLKDDRVSWFTLPSVLSAWRLNPTDYDFSLRCLCEELDLEVETMTTCVNDDGVVSRDPEELPPWARDVWYVSKYAVNRMLTPSADGGQGNTPADLGVELTAQLTRALDPRIGAAKRARRARRWFESARQWIAENLPPERSAHGAPKHYHN
jgi:hypothetical protein